MAMKILEDDVTMIAMEVAGGQKIRQIGSKRQYEYKYGHQQPFKIRGST